MKRTLIAALLASCALSPVARAQPADRTTQKLIQILVKNGVLTAAQADDLLKEAQQEAASAAAVPPPRARALRPPPAILTDGTLPPPAASASPPAPAAAAQDQPAPPGTVRVTYVPDSIRKQIAAEVKQQVMQQSHDEGWTEPNVIPDWIQRIKISGDIRIRGQFDTFPTGNANLFPDFNAINASSNGFDTNSNTLPPLLDTTQNRTRVRLRARLNVEAQVADWVTADIRMATGNDTSPVSTNQTLGSSGDFQKYAIYLDRAYLDLHPVQDLDIVAGRAPNPFWSTDLLFDEELNFDGFAGTVRVPVSDTVKLFTTAGAFPVFNTAFNLSTNTGQATPSNDSYLIAGQIGAEWQITDEYALKIGGAYYDWDNIRGKESSLCTAPAAFGACNTDSSRTPFSQFGNTRFALRNIDTSAGTTTAQPQYYGLASAFQVMDLRAAVTYSGFAPVLVTAEGEFIKNFGFSRRQVVGKSPANNLGSNGNYEGGDTGYMARLTVGEPVLDHLWSWNVSVAYKYLESDSTPDSFTDAKFHLGGTNAKGTALIANLGLSRGLFMSARWYSTTQVSGPAYAIDSFLVDLNASF